VPLLGTPADSNPPTPAQANALRGFSYDFHRLVGKNVSQRDYPRLARDRGWQGSTTIRAEIGFDGLLKAVSVKKSSGFSVLDQAAASKVWQTQLPPMDSVKQDVPCNDNHLGRFVGMIVVG